jgi:hypothetical protein
MDPGLRAGEPNVPGPGPAVTFATSSSSRCHPRPAVDLTHSEVPVVWPRIQAEQNGTARFLCATGLLDGRVTGVAAEVG